LAIEVEQVRIWGRRPSRAAGYATAVGLAGLAQGVRPLLEPHLFIPYTPFLVMAGAIGGLGPGLAATLICTLESLLFTAVPRDAQTWAGAATLVLTGVVTSLVFEALKRDGERLRRAYTELATVHAESKLAEEKLGAAHSNMVSILDSISDGFVVFDRDWRYTYVNAAAARMVHMSPEELLGKKLWDLWPHAWDSPFGTAYRRAVEENIPGRVEAFYPEPLNAWFEVRCYPSPEGLSLFYNDVTERRRSEQELRESQERLSLVIKATGLGLFDWFPQTGRIVWSDAARQHLGVPLEAPASYETFLRSVHPADRERVNDVIRHVLRRDRGGHYETEYRTVGLEDGIVRWLSGWGTVFFDENGLPERFLGVTLEISARKRLEDQFLQAQKLESVGRLAGGVAHDFNNLLTVIIGYAQMLLGDLPGEDASRDPVQEIVYAASRAEELTRQLLAFSRNQVSEPRNIVLNDTLRNFEKMLRRLLGEDVALRLSLGPDAAVIRADPGQIEQVVMNLAVNARDAMPEGGRLVIETAAIMADEEFADAHFGMTPGPYAVLSVRHRRGNVGGNKGTHIRAVLHHQGAGQRHRTGIVDGIWNRAAVGRRHLALQRARLRHYVQDFLSRGGSPRGRPGSGAGSGPSCRGCHHPAGGGRAEGPPLHAADSGTAGLQGAGRGRWPGRAGAGPRAQRTDRPAAGGRHYAGDGRRGTGAAVRPGTAGYSGAVHVGIYRSALAAAAAPDPEALYGVGAAHANPRADPPQVKGAAGYFSLRARSKSSLSFAVILSATSALAPRKRAPRLSWVVDQMTSPALLTRRTAARASWRRSVACSDSLSPAAMPAVIPRESRVYAPLRVPIFP
jgi:PAS domain S-box-containing protein